MSAPNIDNTLGALLLGDIAAAILYGVTCVQTFIYFQNYSGDKLMLKVTVVFLWMCDTVHLALITHSIYFYAVKNFANPAALQDPTLTIMAHIIITCINNFTIRSVFGHRLWKLSGGNVLLVVITIASLVVFAFGISFTILASMGLREFQLMLLF